MNLEISNQNQDYIEQAPQFNSENTFIESSQNSPNLVNSSSGLTKITIKNFFVQHKIILMLFAFIVLLILGYLMFVAVKKKNTSHETPGKNSQEIKIVTENDSSSSEYNESTRLAEYLSEKEEEKTISPSSIPTPTLTPTFFQKKPTILVPTKTPLPSATPIPNLDLHIEWITFPRPGGPGEGCGAGIDLSHPVFCEVASSSQSLVSYFMEVRNNGEVDANNVLVTLTLNGVSTDHKIDFIKRKDKNTITIPLTGNVGVHQGKVVLNPNKNPQETKYDNNEKSFTLEIKPDSKAPSATLDVVNKTATRKCFSPFVMDNVNTEYELNLQLQINSGSWKTIPSRLDPGSELRYEECIDGSSGQEFVGKLKVTDKRGNVAEASANMIF